MALLSCLAEGLLFGKRHAFFPWIPATRSAPHGHGKCFPGGFVRAWGQQHHLGGLLDGKDAVPGESCEGIDLRECGGRCGP